MNELFIDFLTILLPTYFFFYMAITLISRNKKSMLNRIAAFLMLAFLFYFLGEYIKTSLLPEYQMQIVLYGNGPMLLLIISFLVHLCILIGSPVTSSLKRWLPFIYAAPFALLFAFLLAKEHRVLFNAEVSDGRSPLDPLFLLTTVTFVAGYIFLSFVILSVSWYRTKEAQRKRLLSSLLLSLFTLLVWFVLVTFLLQMQALTARYAMILYFIGYLLWAVALRHIISKHDFLPDYRKLFLILFQSAPTAILLLDRKGVIREMNPRAKIWFEGLPEEEVCPRLFGDGHAAGLLEQRAFLPHQRGGEVQWEVRLDTPSKGRLDVMVSLDWLQESGGELLVMHLTDVTSLKETERKLLESEQSFKYLAHHDPLTKLCNRTAIQEQLQDSISRQEALALVLIDLDHFKPINDTYGHLIGDGYLQHIAHILKSNALTGEHVGRIGGDEFVMLFPTEGVKDDLYEAVSKRLSVLNDNPFLHEGRGIPISFSAGVSFYPEDASDVTTLLKSADEAMYRVKRSGKNGVAFFSDNAKGR